MSIGVLASLRGLAMGLCMMPVQTAAYNTVARDQMTRATALTNVLFRIFGAASTAMLTTVLLVSLRGRDVPAGASVTSGTAPLPALAHAFDDTFLLMAAMTGIGLVLALFLRDRVIEGLRARPGTTDRSALATEPGG